jgi:hypothetical protein
VAGGVLQDRRDQQRHVHHQALHGGLSGVRKEARCSRCGRSASSRALRRACPPRRAV